MYGISVLISSRVVSLRSGRHYSKDRTKKLLEFLADMPKVNSGRIAEAQRQRQHISKKAEKYGPSTVYLQVIGSGARGAPNTLYLFTDQKRYLFNCGECTQRLAHEHKVKLSRLDHIFITSKTWRNIGGLPGLSLTLQDVGVPNITLHGPEGLDELYTATQRFVIMKEMNVTMANCSPSEDFEDNVMNVKYVLLGPHESLLDKDPTKPAAKRPRLDSNVDKQFEEFINDETDYYRPEVSNRNKDKSKPKINNEKDNTKKKSEKVLHDLQKKPHCTVAYICSFKKRLGTLDLAKCVELGVKPGPMLGQLKSGHDVVLPDGTLVLSKDVKTPDDPGPVFIVMEVPDISYLKESEFSAHFDNFENPPENIPSVIVHYTPPHVFNHPTYRAFLSLFGPSTRHLVLNSQNSCLGSEAVHRTQHKLHLLDPDIFPLLRDISVPAVWNAHPPVPKTDSPIRLKGLEELKNKIALAQFQNILNVEGLCKGDGHIPSMEEDAAVKLELIAGRTLTMFHLRPKKQLDRSAEPKLHIQDYIQESMDVDGFVGSLEQFRRLVDSMRYTKTDSQSEYPKVVFLGTGSCIPSKTRNTSAIVVHIDETRSILLDCGEGTFGQLVRFYGPKKVNSFLRTLKAIYISHLHADHHIGLIGVLQARKEAFDEVSTVGMADPVYLLAPGQIVKWLNLYDIQFERIKNEYTLIPNQNLLHDVPQTNSELTSAVLAAMGIQQMRTCLVSHCPNAFGVAIDLDGTNKLTYSGDTIPCEELVKIGKNSTLLIHEATMEDELAEEARIKMHSTTTQAIAVGKQMNAKFTVLTHFSQRYARLPRLNANILNDNKSVGIAFDNMQITVNDLELLPHMYAPLQLMFAEHCVEMELKAAHRARHKERASSPNLNRAGCSRRGKRRMSPAWSAPTPNFKYRESNASRLRQEIKGMVVTGRVGRETRKQNKPRSRQRTPSTGSTASRAKTPERPFELTDTSCTMSEMSDGSQHVPEKLKAPIKGASDHVFDTRSKLLNSVNVKGVELVEILPHNSKEHTKKSSTVMTPTPPNRSNTGYGKPLLTPVNKKLTVRRETTPNILTMQMAQVSSRRESSASHEKGSPCSRTRSPTVRKPLSREASISSNKTQSVSSSSSNRSKLPTRVDVAANQARTPIASGKAVTNKSVILNERSTRPLLPTQNKFAKSPTRQRSLDSRIPRPYDVTSDSDSVSSSHGKVKPSRQLNLIETKSSNPDRNKSLQKITTKSKQSIAKKAAQEPERKNSAQIRRAAEKPKFKPASSVTRPSSAIHSNKSFKPQLEDITSSYLILNKNQKELNKKSISQSKMNSSDKGLPSETAKVKMFDDNQRRQQLLEVKRKFQSKGFWNESSMKPSLSHFASSISFFPRNPISRRPKCLAFDELSTESVTPYTRSHMLIGLSRHVLFLNLVILTSITCMVFSIILRPFLLL